MREGYAKVLVARSPAPPSKVVHGDEEIRRTLQLDSALYACAAFRPGVSLESTAAIERRGKGGRRGNRSVSSRYAATAPPPPHLCRRLHTRARDERCRGARVELGRALQRLPRRVDRLDAQQRLGGGEARREARGARDRAPPPRRTRRGQRPTRPVPETWGASYVGWSTSGAAYSRSAASGRRHAKASRLPRRSCG
ncbi:hypothetical protein AB1Y20_006733 [Prymnesium parvum]|uniref:Uncharacterized protein n=1 Tax=Prymnesium parvum TaxID=97485 RepID=A0AB34J1M6_PRYPA